MVIGFGAPLAELEKYFPAKSSDRVLTELSTGHRLADLRMTEPTTGFFFAVIPYMCQKKRCLFLIELQIVTNMGDTSRYIYVPSLTY